MESVLFIADGAQQVYGDDPDDPIWYQHSPLAHVPTIVLPESDVGTFAAVLAGAQLVVANDSGSGHLAAAVGARLISVFGVTEPERTRPWGINATLIGSSGGWPAYAEVRSAVDVALSA